MDHNALGYTVGWAAERDTVAEISMACAKTTGKIGLKRKTTTTKKNEPFGVETDNTVERCGTCAGAPDHGGTDDRIRGDNIRARISLD